MPGDMNDHLLPLERRIEVRDDADLPAGSVRLAALRQRERLGRRSLLASLTERARLELLARRLAQGGPRSAGPGGAARSDDDLASGKGIDAEVDCQTPARSRPLAATSGPMSSIGSGRINVDVRSELISSIVCR
jgi:hypothetical protein